MKQYNKITESITEPSIHDLWIKDGVLYHYNNGWQPLGGGKSESEDTRLRDNALVVGEIDTLSYEFTPLFDEKK